ncbi:cation-translocating P-type ATPase [Pseudonocardia acaciae]|uniref:cation-translocating P-type ATPase n=1 Tax=Pseudonocardia acaciae TaxID=551276 RepID=UPI0006887259|nr:cation-translocating P-type ATPase [Pseudonocardia acaciae]
MGLGSLVRLPVAGVGLAVGTSSALVRAAARTGRVARNAVTVGGEHWRAGGRLHVRLRGRRGGRRAVMSAARAVALALAEHPDVLFAYWDGGPERLVVQLTQDAVVEHVSGRIGELAERHGLAHGGEPDTTELAPSGEVDDVRLAATALALDAVGAAAAVAGRALRVRHSPGMATALATLVREDPRIRSALRDRLGGSAADLTVAAVNAVAHGLGCSPTPLVLDSALRASQLVEAVARTAARDVAQDQLSTPERAAGAGDRPVQRPDPERPSDRYAVAATTASLLASAVALVRGDLDGAAEAVRAGTPRAARYGPAAFAAGVGVVLARAGVRVRDAERLRLLERVDTVVLHPSALCGRGHTDGALDPLADAVLDAARRAGLRVVVVDDPGLGEFAALADEVAGRDQPLAGLVRRLQDQGRTVLTVARLSCRYEHSELLAGLLRGDLAVSVTDPGSAVVWSADASTDGLDGVWRLLAAVPAARRAGRRGRILAEAGTALSGLALVAGPRLPVSPVDVASAGALASGWAAALTVATAGPPTPHHRVEWHALAPDQARHRLARSQAPADSTLTTLVRRARRTAGAGLEHPAMTPARWSLRLAGTTASELADPLTPVLAVGAAASALLGSPVDALLVAGAIGLNAVTGGVQRLRAEEALSGLARGQRRQARRVVGRTTRLVNIDRLAVGDVIALEVGDVVPADARLLELTDLEVDESALTGESLPVLKQVAATPGASLPERRCMVYEGTTVVTGRATALVVGIGAQTEAGRAVALASRNPTPPGLQARLGELTRWALPLTLAGGAAVTGLSLLRGQPVREAVRGGVAVSVAAVPEGLPMVATVAQLAAARRLGRRGVLVRAPRALEALGRVNTVCFDKTGTLTENRLHVVEVASADRSTHRAEDPEAHPVLTAAARACPDGDAADKHATDEAVLAAAPPDPGWRQLDGLPFEAARGYSATVGTDEQGVRQLIVKGAPEVVLERGGRADELADELAEELAEELADKGLRVLAVARRVLADDETPDLDDDASTGELEPLGLLGIADTARETSEALVTGLRAAGVNPVMLTGDHPATALAIAKNLGWPPDTTAVTGDELAALDGAGRAEAVRDAGVVARVAPEQKLQVIEALQAAGRVVGMVGDGANDAAAIRAADVGVGIASRGSAAARNAADVVVTDGDLTVLVDAVTEGRALWHSAADAVGILVGGNAGEVGFSALGTLVGGRSPLSTRQLLLVNLLTDMFPAMAVAVTPSDATDLPPATPDLLGAPLIEQIRRRGVLTGVGAGTAWLIGTLTPGSARRTSTMALCGLVGSQLTQTLRGRERSPLVVATSLGSAAALAAVVQTPGLSHFFGCTPLGPIGWAGVGAAIGTAAIGPHIQPRREGDRS